MFISKDKLVQREMYSSQRRRGYNVVDGAQILADIEQAASVTSPEHEFAFQLWTSVIAPGGIMVIGYFNQLTQLYALRYGFTIASQEQMTSGIEIHSLSDFKIQSWKMQYAYALFPAGDVWSKLSDWEMMLRFFLFRISNYCHTIGKGLVLYGASPALLSQTLRLPRWCRVTTRLVDFPIGGLRTESQVVKQVPSDNHEKALFSRIECAAVSSRTIVLDGQWPKGLKHIEKNHRIIATSFEGRESREFNSKSIGVVLPAGGGKTTLAREFYGVDIDSLFTEELMAELKPLRRAAMERPAKWAIHNERMHAFLRQQSVTGSVIFAHSVEQLEALGVERDDILQLKPSNELHASNIAQRDLDWRRISELNQKMATGRVFRSHQELRDIVSEYIEERLPSYQFQNSRYLYISLANLPDYAYVSMGVGDQILKDGSRFYMCEGTTEKPWFYAPYVRNGITEFGVKGWTPKFSKEIDFVSRDWAAAHPERQHLLALQLGAEHHSSSFEADNSEFGAFLELHDKSQALRFMTQSDSLFCLAPNNLLANVWGRWYNSEICRGSMRIGDTHLATIRPDEVLSVKHVAALTTTDAACILDYSEDAQRRSQERLPGFEGRHPLMSAFTVYVKGSIMDQNAQSWQNSQTHLVRTITAHINTIYGGDVGVFRKMVIMTFLPNLRVSRDLSVHAYGRITKTIGKLSISGHLVNLLLASSFITIDFRRYLDTVDWNVRTVMGERAALNEFDRLAKSNLLSENRDRRTLWHTYWDYYYGVITALLMVKTLKLPFNPKVYRYVIKRLNLIRNTRRTDLFS
jgi:hypothetical protein